MSRRPFTAIAPLCLALALACAPPPPTPGCDGGGCGSPPVADAGAAADGGACVPLACAAVGANCGEVSDGCGGLALCGSCGAGQTCGGGGHPNVCGAGSCTPVGCGARNCGEASDGCGAVLSCGTCGAGTTCGGSGAANVCGAGCPLGCPSPLSCGPTACEGPLSQLGLDVKVFAVSGQVTRNGVNPPCTPNQRAATVNFEEPALGYQFSASILCPESAAPLTFSAVVYPGTYRVRVWTANPEGALAEALVASALEIRANRSDLAFDVRTHGVSGQLTLDGAVPRSGQCAIDPVAVGQLAFEEPTRGYRFTVDFPCHASATPLSFGLPLYPGRYVVSFTGGGDVTPAGRTVLLPALEVAGQLSNLLLDLKTVTLSGTVTVDGLPPPLHGCASAGAQGRVRFTNAEGGTVDARLPCRANGALPLQLSTTLYAGTYRVAVSGVTDPQSAIATLPYVTHDALTLTAPRSGLALDVPTVRLAGAVKVNGAAPSSCGVTSRVLLKEATRGYQLALPIQCPTGAFSGTVVPGTWEVRIHGEAGSGIPSGSDFLARPALALSASSLSELFEVKTLPVSGGVTMDGAQPTSTCAGPSAARAAVLFEDAQQGYAFTLPVPCPSQATPFTFEGALFPGTYRVSVRGGASALPPVAARVRPSLVVSAPVSGLALDVLTRQAAGTVTLNGTQPTSGCLGSGRNRVLVRWEELTLGYTFELPAPCNGAVTPVTFGGALYPGTYRLSVAGEDSNVPKVRYRVAEQVRVP